MIVLSCMWFTSDERFTVEPPLNVHGTAILAQTVTDVDFP